MKTPGLEQPSLNIKELIERRFASTHPKPLPQFDGAVPGAKLLEQHQLRFTRWQSRVRASLSVPPEAPTAADAVLPGIQLRPTLPGGAIPSAVATGDFNRDGHMDFVVANGATNDLWIYLGNGDGTFQIPHIIPLTKGLSPVGLAAVDLRGKGVLDLIVAEYDTATIGVLPGNGDGTFGSPITSTLPFGTQGDQLATGDFNGDGKKDLVTTNGAILLGDGAGHFTATGSRIAVSASGVVVGDWNKDGHPDIAFITTGALGGIVTVYVGNGDGTFAQGNSYATIGGVTFLSASDLDGDGNLDIYVGEANSGDYGPDLLSGGASQALMGNGDGTFAGAQAYPNGTNGGSTRSSVQPFAIASFHGTGYQDVLMQTDTGIEMLTNNGKGSFTLSQVLPGSTPAAMATADIDGDGKNDAVFGEGSSGSFDIAVALGNGDGTFETKITTAVPALPNRLVVGDFNGDGKPDIVMTSGSSVYLLLNQGHGTLGGPTLLNTEANPVTAIVAADLRNNGKLDLVLTEATVFSPTAPGAVGVLLGNGNGTFLTEVHTGLNYMPLAVAVSDMNKDGKLDLIVASSDQGEANTNLYVLPGNGDGTFGTAISTALTYPYVTGLTVADFDSDGNQDVLITTCCGATSTSIASGSGNGAFSGVGSLSLAASSNAAAAADVNGDGKPDLLINSNSAGSDLIVLLSQASTATTTATITSLTASATSVTSGSSVTFTATVAPASGSGAPTGTITFVDGTTTLGTGTVTSGVATFTTSTLANGSHSITAVYSGDTNFATSTSTALSITITAAVPASFTLGLSPTSGTVTSGSTTTSTVTITPSGGFNQQVSFSCSGLPQNVSCNFSPATVTPSGTGMATSTLTIATGKASAALYQPSLPSRGFGGRTALAFLGGGGLLGWTLLRRRKGKKLWYLQLGFALMILAASATVGCGGSAKSTTTPTGTYQIMIIGTTGSATQSATYSLKVQ